MESLATAGKECSSLALPSHGSSTSLHEQTGSGEATGSQPMGAQASRSPRRIRCWGSAEALKLSGLGGRGESGLYRVAFSGSAARHHPGSSCQSTAGMMTQ